VRDVVARLREERERADRRELPVQAPRLRALDERGVALADVDDERPRIAAERADAEVRAGRALGAGPASIRIE
jgi:hypothetical protein